MVKVTSVGRQLRDALGREWSNLSRNVALGQTGFPGSSARGGITSETGDVGIVEPLGRGPRRGYGRRGRDVVPIVGGDVLVEPVPGLGLGSSVNRLPQVLGLRLGGSRKVVKSVQFVAVSKVPNPERLVKLPPVSFGGHKIDGSVLAWAG